jgi:hypothetical protein
MTITALIAIRLAEFLFRCDRTRTKSLIAADLSVRFKCRSDLSAALLESNYSIYSINGGFEERPRGISELGSLVSTPWTHKSFIDKRRLTSQAGRHPWGKTHQDYAAALSFVMGPAPSCCDRIVTGARWGSPVGAAAPVDPAAAAS